MSRGRPADGPKMVERLEGSEEAKQRLRVILETVSGERTVAEACEELGVGKTAFFELRKRVLQASLADLEPKPVGRPRKEVSAEEAEAERLAEENEQLRTDLEIAQVREEIMLAMPEVFDPGRKGKKSPTKLSSTERNQRRRQRQRARGKKKGK